jgi:hypothetical protein
VRSRIFWILTAFKLLYEIIVRTCPHLLTEHSCDQAREEKDVGVRVALTAGEDREASLDGQKDDDSGRQSP